MTLDEYLSQPCDRDDCDRTAIHNGTGRASRRYGKWCNLHTDWDSPHRARND